MFNVVHNGSRHCFRCSHPLTDAASRSVGVGPICRQLDNAILARAIPSNMEAALAAYQTVDPLTLTPETLPTFMALEADLRADDAATRDDWRKTVKRIEWVLSHKQNYNNIKALKAIVLALGYIGLVSLWNGEAATGLALVFGCNGRLFLQGPQNKSARFAFKAIPGWSFHKVGPDCPKALWSVPAGAFHSFRALVVAHYPNFEGLTEALEAAETHAKALAAALEVAKAEAAALKAAEEAKKAAEAPPDLPPPPVAQKAAQLPSGAPLVTIVEADGYLEVSTPFRISYINELRSINKMELPRQWSASKKAWIFPVEVKAQVEALVQKHYGH